MTRRAFVAILAATILLLVGLLWVLQAPSGASLSLALTAPPSPLHDATFRLTNAGPYSICVQDAVVEVKTTNSWRSSSHVTCPPRIEAGTSIGVVVGVPPGIGTWRLRVAYGDEVRYPLLLALKTDTAIQCRSLWPFSEFRLGATYKGSNSLYSAEYQTNAQPEH